MLNSFAITERGQGHIERDTPCQDFSFSQIEDFNGRRMVIAAIADGVGSCEYSHFGAETAVMTIVEFISDRLHVAEDLEECKFEDVIKDGFELALSKIENKAEQMELPFLEFDCTLTAAIYDGDNLWYGHSGDGGIVALKGDSSYDMITKRHKGVEFNMVFPVRDTASWEFGSVSNISSFVMMTDGVLDCCVDIPEHGNRILWPFLEPALTEVIETKEHCDKVRDEFYSFFRLPPTEKGSFRRRVTDDITFLLVTNSEAVSKTEPPSFDLDKWRADTEEYKKKQDEMLYKRFYEYMASKEEK